MRTPDRRGNTRQLEQQAGEETLGRNGLIPGRRKNIKYWGVENRQAWKHKKGQGYKHVYHRKIA